MNLSLTAEKYQILMDAWLFLSHFLYKDGIQVDPNKIAIIRKFLVPQRQKYVRSFLLLARYYKIFIKYLVILLHICLVY